MLTIYPRGPSAVAKMPVKKIARKKNDICVILSIILIPKENWRK